MFPFLKVYGNVILNSKDIAPNLKFGGVAPVVNIAPTEKQEK